MLAIYKQSVMVRSPPPINNYWTTVKRPQLFLCISALLLPVHRKGTNLCWFIYKYSFMELPLQKATPLPAPSPGFSPGKLVPQSG
jgi:hypothetical protein